MAEPRLSVVVPTRDRPDRLASCLAALRASLSSGDELVVVDSFSSDPRVGEVASSADRWLRAAAPGASLARNVGWRTAVHDVVAFVDDDVTVSPGWADGMRGALAAHPDAAFVTGRIDVPPHQAGTERPVAVKTDADPAVIDAASEGTLGHSANLAVRRAALDAIGGFDELLGAGARLRAAEDNDLFDRLLAAGMSGWYEPAALAWHDQWRTRGQLVRLDWAYGVGTGARLAKLRRADPGRARRIAVDALWHNGVQVVPGQVRDRYELGVVMTLGRLAGTVAGFARAGRLPLDTQGRFAVTSPRAR